MFNGWKITNILDVGLCELDTAEVKKQPPNLTAGEFNWRVYV